MGMAKDDMEVFDSLTKYEDFAWVDSCLVEDPIIPPPGEWSCMKDALLEILGSESDTPSVLVDDNVIPLCKKSESGHRFKDKDDNDIYFCEEGENSQTMQHEDDQDEEAADVKDDGDYNTVWYKSAKAKERIRKALRETSRDNFFAANSGSRSGLGLLPTKKEMDTPSDDIFKVWDLGVNVEEDEFSKQMNKLIADNGDDSYLWERPDRVMNEPVDSLVYGIADLSLEQA